MESIAHEFNVRKNECSFSSTSAEKNFFSISKDPGLAVDLNGERGLV